MSTQLTHSRWKVGTSATGRCVHLFNAPNKAQCKVKPQSSEQRCANMRRSAAHCTVEELDTLRSTPFSTGSLLKESLIACNSL